MEDLLDADLGTLPLQYFWTAVTFPSPNLNYVVIKVVWGTGIRGLMRGMATLPQGNQDLLVVRGKLERLPGELGVSKSMECDISLQCFDTVGWVTGSVVTVTETGTETAVST